MKQFKQLAQTLAVAATLLIAQPIQAETFYFHNDHLGTPQVLTDDSGTVVWQGSYKPFGEVTETTATVEQNIRFPGQYFEEETGLHYNYFRDYDPGTGRYIESDPIGLGGGINTFGYAYQNSIKFKDIFGLQGSGLGGPPPDIDPNNLPKPPPPGEPGVQQPIKLPPTIPGKPSCELVLATCMAKCTKKPICKAPVVGKFAKAGCVIVCTSAWALCKFGGEN